MIDLKTCADMPSDLVKRVLTELPVAKKTNLLVTPMGVYCVLYETESSEEPMCSVKFDDLLDILTHFASDTASPNSSVQ